MVNKTLSRKLNIEQDELTEKQGEVMCSGMVSSSCSTICTRRKIVTTINVYSLLDSNHSICMLSMGWLPHYMYTKLYLHCRKGYLDENIFSNPDTTFLNWKPNYMVVWSYGNWIYNYLCNLCLSQLTFW